jgi:hypothetical protein
MYESPADFSMSKANPNLTTAAKQLVLIIPAILLALAAFVLAQWPSVARIDVADLTSSLIGQRMLIAGALPWFLQWAALAVLCHLIARRIGNAHHSRALVAVLVPLAVGASWWIGVAATHWGDNSLEFVGKVAMRSTMRNLAGDTLVQCALFDVLGPLACPLMLRGPYVMAGWSFLWTALSTALVMSLFMWIAQTVAVMNRGRSSNLRISAFLCLGALIYTLPVLLRILANDLHSMPAV